MPSERSLYIEPPRSILSSLTDLVNFGYERFGQLHILFVVAWRIDVSNSVPSHGDLEASSSLLVRIDVVPSSSVNLGYLHV